MKLKYFLCLLLIVISGCSVFNINKATSIRIKGSDTMLILTQLWAEEYMKLNPRVSIYCEGGGSAAGIAALINGETEICAASRPIEPEEVGRLAKKYNSVGMSFTVAKDALSVYLNLDNPVKNLSMKQLKKIFTGEITNWKEAGGEDARIEIIIRPPNSGSQLYFREHVMDGDEYKKDAVVITTTRAVVKEVTKNRNAIGYGGYAYSNDVVNCAINDIAPIMENILNDKYPITRYLFLYTVNMPSGEIKKFLDWTMSTQGQDIVKKVGYIPLW